MRAHTHARWDKQYHEAKISEKLQELRQTSCNTGANVLKAFSVTVGHDYGLCYEMREGHCSHTHTHTHLYTKANILHSLVAALREHSSQCSPMQHTHTMKRIDYFTKNQLGAGYVRAPRATEGVNS